jgi:cell division septum initiation protein DivIVA
LDGQKDAAMQKINEIPPRNPFEMRYDQIHNVDFESCAKVLNKEEVRDFLGKGWK